jgi:quercetin dioxygenase-like cupin family protein
VREEPSWQPFEEYDGKTLERVRFQDLLEPPGALIQLVEIAAGGSFAMHASPDVAFCQIVRGRGKLGLPNGRELDYRGPELYIFRPDTLHDRHDVERTRSSRSASSVSRAERPAWREPLPRPLG